MYKQICSALLSCFGLSANLCLAVENITVDFSHRHQQIDNFGASDAWTFDPMIKKWSSEGKEAEINKLAELLFSTDKGIGLSAWRFNIGAGSKEQGDDSGIYLDGLGKDYRRAELMQPNPGADIEPSKQAGQIRFLQEAAKHGVQDLIIFTNSPPVWATNNGLAHPIGVGASNLSAEMTPQFTQFLVDVATYLRTQKNVPVNYISPINEPTWEWEGQSQEANRYNMAQVKAVYHSLYQQLKQHGLNEQIKIEAGEVVEYKAALNDQTYQMFSADNSAYNAAMNQRNLGLYKNYIDQLLGDPELNYKIGHKISVHGYFSDNWADRMGKLRDLTWQNLQAVSTDAKIWMSEVSILGAPGDVRPFHGHGLDVDDMEYAIHVGKMLHRDLTRLNASAWQWWLAVTPYDYKDGLLKINPQLDADSLQTSKVMWVLGQFSRFIRPGYQRLELTQPDNLNGLMASAYRSPDNNKLVIVAINAAKQSQVVSVNLTQLAEDSQITHYQRYQTDKTNNLHQKNDYLAGQVLNLPAQSVVTLVAQIEANKAEPSSELDDKTKNHLHPPQKAAGSLDLSHLVVYAIFVLAGVIRPRFPRFIKSFLFA
ncbi:xylanase [Catenovulum sp. 2E275]|uniref:glycoside hydrolase n=1 Tax=Catenovulum sp. 2E275 TaxID=2980497 RepID=UPI0021D2679B|nr:glycoside hydrolase [Catenovulum sp. 2E275]MCU4677295.1 xylanase [Catenovulum sp. 2E275]